MVSVVAGTRVIVRLPFASAQALPVRFAASDDALIFAGLQFTVSSPAGSVAAVSDGR